MTPLTRWTLALSPPDACATPREAVGLADWLLAEAPGTTATALRAADRPYDDLFGQDVWWRTTLEGAGPRTLRFDGLATLCEVWLDDALILQSDSMFLAHAVDVTLKGGETLWLAFRALAPRLASKLPRARWRTRLTPRQGLRGVRTALTGQMPGWQPAVDAVGPWRAVETVERGPVRLDDVGLRAKWTGAGGRLRVHLPAPPDSANPGESRDPSRGGDEERARSYSQPSMGPGFRRDEREKESLGELLCAGERTPFLRQPDGSLCATLDLPHVRAWWPSTHGDQPLYPVTLVVEGAEIDLGGTGFRSIAVDRDADGHGFGLIVNGEPVFARGACWVPDPVTLAAGREAIEPYLRRAAEAGLNMVRLSGVGAYEAEPFFDLCDELGLLVWQDFAFANFDYPAQDPAFAALCEAEARQLLRRTQAHPCLAVLCGGSEIAQQAAMMGLPAASRDTPLADLILAKIAAEERPDLPYVPHSPGGGDLPFTVGRGIGHYYGVGAYRLPLADARRANVRFAAECLAFANVPEDAPDPADLAAWKAGVPRDVGAEWDFDDVRDHYLRVLYGEDAADLRASDPQLFLDLSRRVSADLMEATFAEWRRPGSPTRGALVWSLRDVLPGAGWGLLDVDGERKSAWQGLKRALRPVQLSITDEGVDGLALHLINETAQAVEGELTLHALAEGVRPVVRCGRAVTLPPRSAQTVSAFSLLGAFFDFGSVYNFGAPAHDVVVARLAIAGGDVLETVHYPRGRRRSRPAPNVTGALARDGGRWSLALETDRLVEAVWIRAPSLRAEDDGFALTPGAVRSVTLVPRDATAPLAQPVVGVFADGGEPLARFAG